MDTIIKISLDDDVILSIDEQGNELLKFQMKIGEKEFIIKPPCYREHLSLLREHALLVQQFARFDPNMLYLTYEIVSDETKLFEWADTYSKIFQNRKLINRIEKLLFRFFDMPFNQKYFRKNATLFDIQKIFAFMCSLDELVKKNAKYFIEKAYGIQQTKPQSSNSSTKNLDTHLKTSTTPRPSE